MRRPSRPGAVLLLLLLIAGPRAFAQPTESEGNAPDDLTDRGDDPPADVCDPSSSSVDSLLTCLRSGDWNERIDAVDSLPRTLGILNHPATLDPEAAESAIDLLIKVMHEEEDDWISRQLLDDLLFVESFGIERLFRAALRERSINLRAKAVEWLTFEADGGATDDLEALWKDPVPDWMVPDLIRALAEQRMFDYLDDFIDLASDPDPEVQSAAIEALGSLGDEEGRPTLLRLSRHGTIDVRTQALAALSGLPQTEETLDELARNLDAEEPPLRSAAITSLSAMGTEDADTLLIDLLGRTTDERDRSHAIESLEGSRHPDATVVIADLLDRLDPEADRWLAIEILTILENRDDAAALPLLASLGQAARASLGDQLTSLELYLARERTPLNKLITIRTACNGGRTFADAESPRARRIAPRPPFDTVRCWEAPSIAGESWDEDRPVAGTLVMIEEFFERPEGTWVRVESDDVDCWVPLTDLAPVDTPPPEPDPTRPPRLEIDLPLREAHSKAARSLVKAGLLEILEPGSDLDVVAVALTVDPQDPAQMKALAVASIDDENLGWAIDEFRRACCGPLP